MPIPLIFLDFITFSVGFVESSIFVGMLLALCTFCYVFGWICVLFNAFSSISSCFWVPRFLQEIANLFYSIVVLMPVMLCRAPGSC